MRRRYGVAIAAALATAVIVPLVTANASPLTPAQSVTPQGFFRFCAEGQVAIANIDEGVMASKGISITGTIYGETADLISSKSAVNTTTKTIITTSGVEYRDAARTQPKVVRCKMRTAESLNKGAWPAGSENQTGRFVVEPSYGFGSLANGVATSQTDQTCQVINQNTIDNVWANLSPQQRAAAPYQPGSTLLNVADNIVAQGNDWSLQVPPMTVQGSNLVVQATALLSPTTPSPPLTGFSSARFQGAHYCTLVAPEYLRDVLSNNAAVS